MSGYFTFATYSFLTCTWGAIFALLVAIIVLSVPRVEKPFELKALRVLVEDHLRALG
jgi:hypothetical protein